MCLRRARRLAWLGRRPYEANIGSTSQSKSYNPEIPVPSPELVVKFYEWCIQRNNAKTCRDRSNYLKKPLDLDNNHSVKAYRLLYKFLGKEPPKELKIKQSGVDLKVPTDNEVRTAVRLACKHSELLCTVYSILVESGARLEDVLQMLNTYDADRDKWQEGGFWVYELGKTSGTKRSFYIFHWTGVTEEATSKNISKDWVGKTARMLGIVRAKYIRKWVATKMATLGIPESIIDFIQGRTPRKILSQHYLNLYALALNHYPQYMNTVKKLLWG